MSVAWRPKTPTLKSYISRPMTVSKSSMECIFEPKEGGGGGEGRVGEGGGGRGGGREEEEEEENTLLA